MQLAGATVLVVDDDELVRSGLVAMLEDEGASVLEAKDGAEALRLALGPRAMDLVLTDIVMPEGEGMSLILALRRQCPDTRIVAMTGGGRIPALDYLSAATEFGVAGTLLKPFDWPELAGLIERL